MTGADLVRSALLSSKLSVHEFATYIVGDSVKSVRDWIRGEELVPESAQQMLEWFIGLSSMERRWYVAGALAMRGGTAIS